MRGWVKGSIAVLMAALVCAAGVPGASAAQRPEESEGIYLELTPRKDVQVWLEVRPQIGVAVVDTVIGRSKEGASRPRNGSVDYAVRIPKDPLEGRLALTIPGVASIVGEVLPAGGGLEFRGSFHFTGNGGYLSFDTDRATGGTRSGGSGGCGVPECRASRSSLFEYVYTPLKASNFNTQILTSERSTGRRTSLFQATHYVRGAGSTFRAQTVEWLPGNVAVERTLELARTSGADFKVSSKAERPKSATVRPPAPFSGTAHYERVGSVRSASNGKLSGSLAVDIFGVKAPLAGGRAEASLFNFNPGF